MDACPIPLSRRKREIRSVSPVVRWLGPARACAVGERTTVDKRLVAVPKVERYRAVVWRKWDREKAIGHRFGVNASWHQFVERDWQIPHPFASRVVDRVGNRRRDTDNA